MKKLTYILAVFFLAILIFGIIEEMDANTYNGMASYLLILPSADFLFSFALCHSLKKHIHLTVAVPLVIAFFLMVIWLYWYDESLSFVAPYLWYQVIFIVLSTVVLRIYCSKIADTK